MTPDQEKSAINILKQLVNSNHEVSYYDNSTTRYCKYCFGSAYFRKAVIDHDDDCMYIQAKKLLRSIDL